MENMVYFWVFKYPVGSGFRYIRMTCDEIRKLIVRSNDRASELERRALQLKVKNRIGIEQAGIATKRDCFKSFPPKDGFSV